jgi:hypothetical protein
MRNKNHWTCFLRFFLFIGYNLGASYKEKIVFCQLNSSQTLSKTEIIYGGGNALPLASLLESAHD